MYITFVYYALSSNLFVWCVRACAHTYMNTLICRKYFLYFLHVLIFVWRYGSWRCIERYVQAVSVALNLTHRQIGVTNFQIAF